AEGTAGLPDTELVSMASDAGATGSNVKRCIDDLKFGGWAADTTDAFFKIPGGTGTPTVVVNGTKLDGFDAATIKKAVKEAGAQGPSLARLRLTKPPMTSSTLMTSRTMPQVGSRYAGSGSASSSWVSSACSPRSR